MQYTLINPMKDLKVIATVFAVFALVWEVILSFGLTFGFRQHESFFAWVFVIFTTLLNIPAILCSWRWPRFSAYWLAFNTACSILIALGTVLKKYSVLRHAADHIPLSAQFSGHLFGGILGEAAALWLVQMLLCALLLLSSRKTDDLDDRKRRASG